MYHFDALWPSFVHWKSVIQLFRFLRATLNRPGGLYKPLREKSIRENHSFSVPRTLVPSFNQMRLFHARVIVSYRSSPDPPSLLLFFLDYTSHENEKICKKKKKSHERFFRPSKVRKVWKNGRGAESRRRVSTEPAFANSIHFESISRLTPSPRSPSSCSRSRFVNQCQDNAKGRHNGGCV